MTVTAPVHPRWRTWFGAVTAGKVVGFLVPACAGALLADPPARAPVAVGAVEEALQGGPR